MGAQQALSPVPTKWEGACEHQIQVLHLRDTYEVGGPGKTILATQRTIDHVRFRLHLGVVLKKGEVADSPFISAARAAGLSVHELRGRHQYDPRIILEVCRLVRRLGIDILHAHEISSDVITFIASLVCGIPIVTTLHGWIENSAKRRLMAAIDRRLVRRFDRVIVVSEYMERQMLALGTDKNRLKLLRNAVAVEDYRRSGCRVPLSTLLGRPIPEPIVVSIGRLSKEKGHLDLLEAVSIATSRGARFSLVLVGDGPERQTLERRIRELALEETAHLAGYLSNIPDVLESASLVILPSHTEGLPNVALEALAMQVPVVATNVGGSPEIVQDGVTGRLVRARSPEAIANAILDFLAHPGEWRAMGLRGEAMVALNFSFSARTRNLEELYLGVR